jgi:hypothetical protein
VYLRDLGGVVCAHKMVTTVAKGLKVFPLQMTRGARNFCMKIDTAAIIFDQNSVTNGIEIKNLH